MANKNTTPAPEANASATTVNPATAPAPAPAAAAPAPARSVKQLFAMPQVLSRFGELFAGDKAMATSFVTNVLSVVNNSEALKKADPNTILTAALLAAAVKLPVTPGLGFAAIVPFWNGKTKTQEAQFQIMTRGYLQLAQRTGRVARVTASEVYEGEVSINRFTDDIEYHERTSDRIVGYLAYVRLDNGFEKFLFMTIEQLQNHAAKYSQTYQRFLEAYQRDPGTYLAKTTLWVSNFDAMAKKTVLKLLLSKWCPLATDETIMKAVQGDGAVLREGEGGALNPDYVDNPAHDTVDLSDLADEVESEPAASNDGNASELADAMKRSVSEAK